MKDFDFVSVVRGTSRPLAGGLFSVVFFCLLLLVSMATAQQAAAANLIENSSFEAGIDSRFGMGRWMEDGLPSGQLDSSTQVHGKYSVRFPTSKPATLVKSSNSVSLIFRTTRPITLRGGTTYKFSASVRSDVAINASLSLSRDYISDHELGSAASSGSTAAGLSWKRIELTYTPGSNIVVFPQVSFNGKVEGHVWIDALQLSVSGEDYAPNRPLEAGLTSPKLGNIYAPDEPITVTLGAYNDSNVARNNQGFTIRVYNLDKELVLEEDVSINIPAQSGVLQPVTLPLPKRGFFRAELFINGSSNMESDMHFSVIPEPRDIPKGEGNFGAYITMSPEPMAIGRRIGMTWLASLSVNSKVIYWNFVEPAEGQFLWYDEEVDAAIAAGYDLMFNLEACRTPSWASGLSVSQRRAKWANYVSAMVNHYKDRVKYWTITDEININNKTACWTSPAGYAPWHSAGYAAIKAADPTAKVIMNSYDGFGRDVLEIIPSHEVDVFGNNHYHWPTNGPVTRTKAVADQYGIEERWLPGISPGGLSYYTEQLNPVDQGRTDDPDPYQQGGDFYWKGRNSLIAKLTMRNISLDFSVTLNYWAAYVGNTNDYWGMFEPDSSLQPLAAQFGALTWLLDGYEGGYRVSLNGSAIPIDVYRVDRRDGKTVFGFWHDGNGYETAFLDGISPNGIAVYDLVTNPVPVRSTNGGIQFAMNDDVSYMIVPSSQANAIEAAFKNVQDGGPDSGGSGNLDSDGDGVFDTADNCVNVSNADQADHDNDGQGNVCDPDDDNDTLPDTYEVANNLNPLNAADAGQDADNDGFSNLEEFQAGTNPQDPASNPGGGNPPPPDNANPVAQSDTANTNEDDSVTVDVLSNDSDPDGDTVSLTSAQITNGAAGSLSTAGGQVTFNPGTDYNGLAVDETATVQVAYGISDGRGGSATGQLTITVNGTNDVALISVDYAMTTEDQPAFNEVASDDLDPDGDELSLDSATIRDGMPGRAVISGLGVTFHPDTGYNRLNNGQSSKVVIDYVVSDPHGGASTGTYNVTVNGINDAPSVVDDTASTPAESAVTVDVLANDSDPEEGALSLTSASITNGASGTVSTGGGQVTYDPAGSYNDLAQGDSATVVISYGVSDGDGGSANGALTVTVTGGANSNPVAEDDSTETTEASAVAVNVLSNDSDPDGDTVSLTGATISNGATGLVSTDGSDVTYDPNGTYDSLNSGDSATVVITYDIADGNGGTGNGTLTVTVNGTGNAATAVDDVAETDEDTALPVDVLANDSDRDGGSGLILTAASITNGAAGSVSTEGGQVTYDPEGAYNGLSVGDNETVVIAYGIEDDQGGSDEGTLTVTVKGANDDPSAAADSDSTDPGTAIEVDVLANDSDPDENDSLSLSDAEVTNGARGQASIVDGKVRYDPTVNNDELRSGDVVEIAYGIGDGQGGTAKATLSVTISVAEACSVVGTVIGLSVSDSSEPGATHEVRIRENSLDGHYYVASTDNTQLVNTALEAQNLSAQVRIDGSIGPCPNTGEVRNIGTLESINFE